MHFIATLVAVGSAASLVSASGFEFPSSVPMSKRQTSGPAYEYHANCGYAIQDSAQSGYCDDSKWRGLLSGCLDCALKYNIWQYYGDKVSAAAKACGLDATPKPASGTSGAASSEAASTTAAETSTQTSAPATETPSEQSSQPVAETSSQTSVSSEVATSVSSAAVTTATQSDAVTTAHHTTGAVHTNATSTQVQVGAANLQKPGMVAAGAVAMFAVNMI